MISLKRQPSRSTAAQSLAKHRQRAVSDSQRHNLNQPLIIILDDLDFAWTQRELNIFLARWNQNQPLDKIAPVLRPILTPRDALDETTLLAMHLNRKGLIKTGNISDITGNKSDISHR